MTHYTYCTCQHRWHTTPISPVNTDDTLHLFHLSAHMTHLPVNTYLTHLFHLLTHIWHTTPISPANTQMTHYIYFTWHCHTLHLFHLSTQMTHYTYFTCQHRWHTTPISPVNTQDSPTCQHIPDSPISPVSTHTTHYTYFTCKYRSDTLHLFHLQTHRWHTTPISPVDTHMTHYTYFTCQHTWHTTPISPANTQMTHYISITCWHTHESPTLPVKTYLIYLSHLSTHTRLCITTSISPVNIYYTYFTCQHTTASHYICQRIPGCCCTCLDWLETPISHFTVDTLRAY